MWEVRCPVHGLHHVSRKTEPIVCKIKVQRSPRYIRHIRQCGKRLTSAVQIRQKKRPILCGIDTASAGVSAVVIKSRGVASDHLRYPMLVRKTPEEASAEN